MDNQAAKKPPEPPKRLEELIEYFERGKSFTEELMKENERLRMRALKLEHRISQLEQDGGSSLLEENRLLRDRVDQMEARWKRRWLGAASGKKKD